MFKKSAYNILWSRRDEKQIYTKQSRGDSR